MKNTKERLIWSSNIYDFGAEDEIEAAYQEFVGLNPETSYSKEDFLYDEVELGYETLGDEIRHYERKYGLRPYLVRGQLGLWNGVFPGGQVIYGLSQAIGKCLEDNNRVYQSGRRLCVSAAHHDGTNQFEIFELTEKGEAWYINATNRCCTREEICETLYNNRGKYCVNVEMFNNVYGWMKPLRKEH